MKNFMSNLFSWKTARRLVIYGLAGSALFMGLSGIAAIGAISTAVAAGISTVMTIGAVAGMGAAIGGIGLTVAKGLVNGVRYIFSKSYRNQVKENRKNKKNKNKDNTNVNARTNQRNETKEKKPNIFKRMFNKLFKRKNKDNVVETEPEQLPRVDEEESLQRHEEEEVRERPHEIEVTPIVNEEERRENPDLTVITPEQQPKVNTSRKAAGFYDKLSDDNKALYEDIVKKNKPAHLFGSFSADEARKLKETYNDTIKEYREIAKERELTDAEQKTVLAAIALRTKVSAYIRKKDKDGAETAFENNEQNVHDALQTVENKIKR